MDILESLKRQFPEFAEEIEDSFSEEGRYSSWGKSGSFTADGTEYTWIADEDEAERIALDIVKQDLEDDPSLFSRTWITEFVYITPTDRRIIAGEEADSFESDSDDDDILNAAGMDDEYNEIGVKIAEIESELEQLDEVERGKAEMKIEDLEEEKVKLVDKARESVHDSKYEEVYESLADPIQYFCHDLGIYSQEELLKQNFISIDVNEAAKDAVSTDGWAHFLSLYDGNYDTTNDGVVYLREG